MGQLRAVDVWYVELVTKLHHEIAQCYDVPRSQLRAEAELIRRRTQREGISFLTKTLPAMDKAVTTALSSNKPLSIKGFKTPPNSAIPRFLGWLLRELFDVDGHEKGITCPLTLIHFRQLTGLLPKLRIEHTPEQEKSMLDAFVQTEVDLSKINLAEVDQRWLDRARDLVTCAVCTVDPQRIQPRHGPGNVATGEDVFEKTKFSRIYPALEAVYPFTEWMCFSLTHVADELDEISRLEDGGLATAKVVLVPKDSRGPRVISAEPLEVQYIQQGLGIELQNAIEHAQVCLKRINFTRQDINRKLALAGSKDQQWVTLDMKEASDRVKTGLVDHLFSGHPELLAAMHACRSPLTRLPCGTILTLDKFAPMGSRLCFPVEALCFWALIVSALIHHGKPRRYARENVYVYGDDIIMRREDYPLALQYLPQVGLMFNERKCCVAGFFRESCGCDAYKGVDVTPTRLRATWSNRREIEPETLVSYAAFSNALYGRGYRLTAAWLRQQITKIYGKIPYTAWYTRTDNGAYVWEGEGVAFCIDEPVTSYNKDIVSRWDADRHFLAYRTWASTPKKERTRYDGWSELLRRFTASYGNHGGSYAMTRRNRLKRVWSQI